MDNAQTQPKTFLDDAINTSSEKITSAVATLASLNMTRQVNETFVDSINKMPQVATSLGQSLAEFITLINARNEMLRIVKAQNEQAAPAAPAE